MTFPPLDGCGANGFSGGGFELEPGAGVGRPPSRPDAGAATQLAARTSTRPSLTRAS